MMLETDSLSTVLVIAISASVFTARSINGDGGSCNTPLGLSSGDIDDSAITSEVGEASTPAMGRINNAEGAWCFSNSSVSAHTAIVTFELPKEQFVSGMASQGPPVNLHPKSYNHLIAFAASHSLDNSKWSDFNNGNLFFTLDKNNTADVISYHATSTIELARYVRVNVTLQVSEAETMCLRIEIYGCDTDVEPFTGVQATTTTTGQIQVFWKQPTSVNTLDPEADVTSIGEFSPTKYFVFYRPLEGEKAFVETAMKEVLVDDVRLGATYAIDLQCSIGSVVVECGSTTVEAYPPCPTSWSGNEYHCFLLVESASSFADIRSTCLNSDDVNRQLGPLGDLVDKDEEKFVTSRILTSAVREFWVIAAPCIQTEDCCQILSAQGDGSLESKSCDESDTGSAMCIRDHKGEGALLRVSSVEANDATTMTVLWGYEGTGWKTDELQARLWIDGRGEPQTLTFSTLEDRFQLKGLTTSTMYSLLLRPAPNIRTDEQTIGLIIIEFPEGSPTYGGFFTPVKIFPYVLWSGVIRIVWDEAKALSAAAPPMERKAEKYSISHQMAAATEESPLVEETGTEHRLTPVAMNTNYTFRLKCYFLGVEYECGEVVVFTAPPSRVVSLGPSKYVMYQVMQDERRWSDAEEECQKRSGHLISLLDEKEDQEILRLLPTKDAKVWTGAKLGRTGYGYWTDGNKITYLPMAKNSGVTSAADSCCKAFTESGKLRVSGGDCREKYPYICKFEETALINSPESVQADVLSWDSIIIKWNRPMTLWAPTFYRVYVCQLSQSNACAPKVEQLKQPMYTVNDLKEFTEYDVTVEAILQPVNFQVSSGLQVMTYPKKPVQCNISSDGILTLSARILVAKRRQGETLHAALYDVSSNEASLSSSSPILEASGPVTMVTLKGLTPGETYKLELKTDDAVSDLWQHSFSFTAAPTCPPEVLQVDATCYKIERGKKDADEAAKQCQQKSAQLWKPISVGEMNQVSSLLETTDPREYWIALPEDTDSIIDVTMETESCPTSTGDAGNCCSYSFSDEKIVCSCCNVQKTFICTYRVKATLGIVQELKAASVSTTSASVKWSPPATSWDIKLYEVTWKGKNLGGKANKIISAEEIFLDDLETGTTYDLSVIPYGTPLMKGETETLVFTTIDPNPPVSINITEDGVVSVGSPKLTEKGRGEELIEVKVYEVDPTTGAKTPVADVRGQAKNVTITGLTPGKNYTIEVRTEEQTPEQEFNHNTSFIAYPTCPPGQIQQGLVCIWVPGEERSWNEAITVCRDHNGKLLDPSTQEEMSSFQALLESQTNKSVWVDVSKAALTSEQTSNMNEQCSDGSSGGQSESDALCCSYKVLPDGSANNFVCTCCDEKKAFACKFSRKIDLGQVNNINIVDVTPTSVTLIWQTSDNAWNMPSYLVTWKAGTSSRRRRSNDQMVVDEEKATVGGLRSGTSYLLEVAPFLDGSVAGQPTEITVITRDDIVIAGIQESNCMIVILKIICCTVLIFFVGITIFIYLVTRMFYQDCLTQLCSELGLIAAYLCILISSSQSYSIDDNCLRARPTLCIATAVLIQFFFQVVFLFMLLECVLICKMLKKCFSKNFMKTPWSVLIVGWGLPAIMIIISAATASDEFTDGTENCWLNISGKAMLPSLIPISVFIILHLLLLLPVLLNADVPEDLAPIEVKRARAFLNTRWVSAALLVLTTISWSTGMMGAHNRDSVLNVVFVVFSILLGFAIIILRIRSEEQVKDHLSKGLFSGLRESSGKMRVTPTFAFAKHDQKMALTHGGTYRTSSRQSQFGPPRETELADFAPSNNEGSDRDVIWHR